MAEQAIADVKIQRESTLFLVFPLTPEGTDWINANVNEDATYWGAALVVDQRYIEDIVQGMIAEGLRVI